VELWKGKKEGNGMVKYLVNRININRLRAEKFPSNSLRRAKKLFTSTKEKKHLLNE
jgi:hypothetical protein